MSEGSLIIGNVVSLIFTQTQSIAELTLPSNMMIVKL
jgi:hypothetical protein